MQKDALFLRDRISEGKFSKCGSYIISSSIFWEPVENADSWALPQACWISNSGIKAQKSVLRNPSGFQGF